MKKLLLLSLVSLLSFNLFASNLVKGTVVTLADGIEISIEEVRVGDALLTLDLKNKKIGIYKVQKIRKAKKSNLEKINLASGSELILSSDHPVMSELGWASSDAKETLRRSNYADKDISEYNLDSFVYSIDSNFKVTLLPIIEIQEYTTKTESYSLELENRDVAFIANGIFVGQY